MGESKNPTRLAAAMAIILGAGASGEADAQSTLDRYSRDVGGGSSAAPASATRDTVINARIPRLQAVLTELQGIQSDLNSHSHPHPGHPPHSHPPPPPPPDGDQDADQDTGDQDTGDQDTGGDSPSPADPIDGFDPGMSNDDAIDAGF